MPEDMKFGVFVVIPKTGTKRVLMVRHNYGDKKWSLPGGGLEMAELIDEGGRREVKEEMERAQANLREESADIAIRLAGKLIEKNLDDERNKKLVDEFIREI